MPRSVSAALRLSEPGASSRRVPGDRDSPFGFPPCIEFADSLRKTVELCRLDQPSELPEPLGERRAGATSRRLPKDARRAEIRCVVKCGLGSPSRGMHTALPAYPGELSDWTKNSADCSTVSQKRTAKAAHFPEADISRDLNASIERSGTPVKRPPAPANPGPPAPSRRQDQS